MDDFNFQNEFLSDMTDQPLYTGIEAVSSLTAEDTVQGIAEHTAISSEEKEWLGNVFENMLHIEDASGIADRNVQEAVPERSDTAPVYLSTSQDAKAHEAKAREYEEKAAKHMREYEHLVKTNGPPSMQKYHQSAAKSFLSQANVERKLAHN